MKLQLNKLMAGLVLAGSVVALVGCGGGDAPTLTVKSDAVTDISPATVSTAKVIVAAASGVDFTLPGPLTFPNLDSTKPAASTPANTVLEITEKPGATGNQLGNFAMSAGAGNEVAGGLDTGSCRFVVTSVTGIFVGLGWTVGQTFFQENCALTLKTSGAAVGGTSDVPLVLTIGSASVEGNVTIEVTIEAGEEEGTAGVKIGDEVISEEPLPTGGN